MSNGVVLWLKKQALVLPGANALDLNLSLKKMSASMNKLYMLCSVPVSSIGTKS
ncbi:uncharacterized protein PHALS_09400 [Plasmopara halstedii]|uniref:Uncharacterized protein n=1 Tax=Plasmopara halstedii TaxID=4781 RepID=A0A0P1A4L7_PLAHL|nr:uncharacterized protein PHALS_09400 [Plasmopara halstedii]CEG35273.1 hypothetical protein PHALS_09400 [Plasmopara halstedii]|eukprot:XP_024571642.1 hypothetical protein PHALS_09400 [Plasmopara halstedii]